MGPKGGLPKSPVLKEASHESPKPGEPKAQRSHNSHAAKRGGTAVQNYPSSPSYESQTAATRGSAAEEQGAGIKKGWQTKTLGEICEVMNGGTPKTGVPEYWDGKHRWITPAEMGKRLSPYVGETERMITDLGLLNSSAPRQSPSLTPPRWANPTARVSFRLDKTWGQRQFQTPELKCGLSKFPWLSEPQTKGS